MILFVDDNDDDRELFRVAMERFGARVVTAASAREALDAYRRATPDLIVSNIGMPRESGHDLLRAIRALERESGWHVPAVALTARASADDRERSRAAGFEMHVVKPVSLGDFAENLARLVRRA